MTKDKERDDALITEAYRRSMEDAEYDKTLSGSAILELRCRHLLRLERSGWKPKPDRAEVLVHELWIMDSGPSQSVWLEVVRRHFAELRAEWEAERPAVVVPENVAEAAEWIWAHKALSSRENLVMHFIRSLDGAKGGE